MHFTEVMDGMQLHVRRRKCVPFLVSRKQLADCVEIWYVVSSPLLRLFTKAKGGKQLHVRTCAPLFRISETLDRLC